MKKPLIIAIIFGVVVGGISFGVYLLVKNTPKFPSTVVEQREDETKLLDWKDPAGFIFQYPEGVTVNKHDEDKVNYAHVEMTHTAHPGRLIVWAKDTTAADVAAWVKTEKSFRDASILDTTLGGQPAKKILISSPTNKIVVGTIFDEIVWYIEGEPGEGDYWQKTFDTVAASFTFTPLPGESSSGVDTSGGEEVTVDEEEVIE